ncbi:Hypothetical predicted protein [Olea europaea subsp. europaea]|uniref:Uncharacterized protein n=1 Tax=Olea europaea subsp. europaea TaxID=158383 RepID=A0A8S0TKB2_OLEEU|nr:Hypothetical predicted protein [Olea europaea subsp. europaea]
MAPASHRRQRGLTSLVGAMTMSNNKWAEKTTECDDTAAGRRVTGGGGGGGDYDDGMRVFSQFSANQLKTGAQVSRHHTGESHLSVERNDNCCCCCCATSPGEVRQNSETIKTNKHEQGNTTARHRTMQTVKSTHSRGPARQVRPRQVPPPAPPTLATGSRIEKKSANQASKFERSTSCSDSDRLKGDDDEAEISSLTSHEDQDPPRRMANTTTTTTTTTTQRRHLLLEARRKQPTVNRWSVAAAGASSSSSLNSLSSSLNSLEARNEQAQRESRPSVGRSFGQLASGYGGGPSSGSAMNLRPGQAELHKRRPAPLPPKTPRPEVAISPTRASSNVERRRSQSAMDLNNNNNTQQQQQQQRKSQKSLEEAKTVAELPKELLSEQEVHAIEHFLKSHRSSVYVCGCMANLYFTKTHLVDNGRASKASNSEWKLNKTGVPVLIFDSGLAKNRQKKRLSISLTERGSGFVLWSDTIDHLSNYRAFSPSLHSIDGQLHSEESLGQQANRQIARRRRDRNHPEDTCDSFHVMYLSSNHRIMVGLSFDDPICARLFLAQIELVCSDPSNISLTGPKSYFSSGRLRTGSSSASLIQLGGQQVSAPAGGASGGGQPVARAVSAAAVGRRLSVGRLFNFRSASRATRFGPTGSENHAPQSSSWSTLKRAAMRGLGGGVVANHQPIDPSVPLQTGGASTASHSPGELRLLEAFKPRPLAKLAAEGKVWQTKKVSQKLRATNRKLLLAGRMKRLPRKCDISAPCLFQHVTRIDQANLAQLYSKSFVEIPQQAKLSPVAQLPRASNEPEVISTTPISNHHLPDGGDSQTGKEQKEMARETLKATAKSASLSSSSSCYSSGSSYSTSCAPHSPTTSSSEGDHCSAAAAAAAAVAAQAIPAVNQNRRNHAGQGARRTATAGGRQLAAGSGHQLIMVARPPVAPPKPPQRDPPGNAPALATTFRRRPMVTGSGATSTDSQRDGRTKIKSILRELQAQVPGELVDAKRRLLADIADRVSASAHASTQARRETRNSSSNSTPRTNSLEAGGPRTSISRL